LYDRGSGSASSRADSEVSGMWRAVGWGAVQGRRCRACCMSVR
jgi:hypothetical protein